VCANEAIVRDPNASRRGEGLQVVTPAVRDAAAEPWFVASGKAEDIAFHSEAVDCLRRTGLRGPLRRWRAKQTSEVAVLDLACRATRGSG